ncbi:MAG: helix-turn-helix domain-containing protein, partial [Dehalococcoidia bacterium]
RPVPPRRLGAWLRAERLRRSESLAEVERDIHVTRAYLEAIEEEHFDVLPAPVYTRGFVRLYARRLGLDAAEAVALLPADLPIPPGLEPSAALRRPGREAPAITLPRVPSMRVPALRIPEMRTPRGGFRLPSLPSLPARATSDGAGDAGGGVDVRRWGLAGLGALVLILSAVFLPRLFENTSPATTTPTPAAATAQATVQAGGTPVSGGASSATPTAGSPQPTATAAASGGIAVPNLVGVARADAQARLQDAGLTSVVVEIASATVPAGQVASQQPAAGANLNRGENVTLIVSRGAPRN